MKTEGIIDPSEHVIRTWENTRKLIRFAELQYKFDKESTDVENLLNKAAFNSSQAQADHMFLMAVVASHGHDVVISCPKNNEFRLYRK